MRRRRSRKGFTLIPVRLYFRNGRVKCEIALAKGKMEYDKRATEKKREGDNEAKAAIARSQRPVGGERVGDGKFRRAPGWDAGVG